MRFRKRRILLTLIAISIFLCAASCMSFILSLFHISFTINHQTDSSKCEVVHIGIVSVGYEPTYEFHTMLKSLYFHRNNPLHFHIIVDNISEKVLKILFETWVVPQVSVSFYNIQTFAPDISHQLKTQHSQVKLLLLKMAFSGIIPTSVTNKLIVLDQHLFFTDDIYDLWALFDTFNEQQIIGLAESQRAFHRGKGELPLGLKYERKRFNYGVMLCHLERFRNVGWNNLWLDVANETLFRVGISGLADHNIIDAVVAENLELVYTLSCYWNTHFSSAGSDYSCYDNNEIKIMQWNFPKNSVINDDEVDYFRAMYAKFAEYNGNLLRKQLHGCMDTFESDFMQPIDECFDFHKSHNNHWRTLLFFRKFKHISSKNDVTYVSQLTYDRLKLVEEICERWDGPMSLTLYVTDAELHKSINFIENSTILKNRYNVAYHAVFKEDYYHPINILRNIALRNVITPFVFVDDIDLLPMHGLYPSLKQYLTNMDNMEKKALVVPAFQTMQYGGQIPKTRQDVFRMLNDYTLIPFSYWRFPEGHGPTNYTKWKEAVAPYEIEWQRDYEPYIVVQRNVSEYDERFVGYGWDKTSHIMKLAAQSYTFMVLPNAFITHKDHPPSSDESHFLELPRYRRCLESLGRTVVNELNEKYNQNFTIK